MDSYVSNLQNTSAVHLSFKSSSMLSGAVFLGAMDAKMRILLPFFLFFGNMTFPSKDDFVVEDVPHSASQRSGMFPIFLGHSHTTHNALRKPSIMFLEVYHFEE
mmetsp:Transcript_36827/g.76623  ORF Transcript_36827/g.76623 Transcript_36827/m.76623 type:complete len:104 (+) Transcript_36827:31-342(+)